MSPGLLIAAWTIALSGTGLGPTATTVSGVSDERLAALRPEDPDGYRAYAQELSAMREDPEAQVLALRLYQLAAHLDPARLGHRCVLDMIPLARTAVEERRFRAMAFSLDANHDPAILQTASPQPNPSMELDARQADILLQPLRVLRQGDRRAALALARRHKLKERMSLLGNRVTYEEFAQACALTCPHCTRGHQSCPACGGTKFVAGRDTGRVACPTCGAQGDVRCAACGGDYLSNPLPPSLLERIVRLEVQWLLRADPEPHLHPTVHPAWSRTVQQGQDAPARDLTLETLTEFDPRDCRFQDGRWTH